MQKPRLITLIKKQPLSPGLLRLVFGGDLQDYPQSAAAAAVKLMFPQDGQTLPVLPELQANGRPHWPDPSLRPWLRTYTLRHFDRAAQQLVIDFVLHAASGPACDWARRAQPGDQLGISVPRDLRSLPESGSYWFAGDLSSLPAISGLLEQLPDKACGQVAIQIENMDDRLSLQHPAGMNLHWLLPDGRPGQLCRWAQQAGLAAAVDPLVWIAAEHLEVLAVRDWVRNTLQLPGKQLHAVPYWRRDFNEEAYHEQRHEVMDEH
jgi:NADPH-dependent ferric siderophore reductase